jgi:hypoxanthine-DNA glycosylase
MNKAVTVVHPFEPVYDRESRVLVLGTMPSPASRVQGFYYGHPRNRFWQVLAAVFGEPFPRTVEERRSLALRRGIALWDVLASCGICGAADSSIENPVCNDFRSLIAKTGITRVFTTGAKAYVLYTELGLPQTGIPAEALPSTSGANARYSLAELTERYMALADVKNPAGAGR